MGPPTTHPSTHVVKTLSNTMIPFFLRSRANIPFLFPDPLSSTRVFHRQKTVQQREVYPPSLFFPFNKVNLFFSVLISSILPFVPFFFFPPWLYPPSVSASPLVEIFFPDLWFFLLLQSSPRYLLLFPVKITFAHVPPQFPLCYPTPTFALCSISSLLR